MTHRQKINLVLAALAGLVLAIVPLLDPAPPWASAAIASAGAFLVGLLTPGSPVDRALDSLTSKADQEAADAVADALSGVEVVRARPRRRRREGHVLIDLLGMIVCLAAGVAALVWGGR